VRPQKIIITTIITEGVVCPWIDFYFFGAVGSWMSTAFLFCIYASNNKQDMIKRNDKMEILTEAAYIHGAGGYYYYYCGITPSMG
jgi:hypothetical protein